MDEDEEGGSKKQSGHDAAVEVDVPQQNSARQTLVRPRILINNAITHSRLHPSRYSEYLVVFVQFVVEQNLVGIAAVSYRRVGIHIACHRAIM